MPLAVSSANLSKTCQPFNLDVMVFSPEAGYKFELSVDRSCSPTLDPIWKLIFDLWKLNESGNFDQIVHVAFTGEAPEEQSGIQSLAANGVSDSASEVIVDQVYPATKALEGISSPSAAQKATLHGAMSQVALSQASQSQATVPVTVSV